MLLSFKATPASPKKTPVSPIKTLNKNLKNKPNALNRQPIEEHLLPHSNKRNQMRRESRRDLESLAALYYVLEIVRRCTGLNERDAVLFKVVIEILEQIESKEKGKY